MVYITAVYISTKSSIIAQASKNTAHSLYAHCSVPGAIQKYFGGEDEGDSWLYGDVSQASIDSFSQRLTNCVYPASLYTSDISIACLYLQCCFVWCNERQKLQNRIFPYCMQSKGSRSDGGELSSATSQRGVKTF